MMKILPILIIVFGIAGGAGAGFVMRPVKGGDKTEADGGYKDKSEKGGKEKSGKKGKEKDKKSKKGGDKKKSDYKNDKGGKDKKDKKGKDKKGKSDKDKKGKKKDGDDENAKKSSHGEKADLKKKKGKDKKSGKGKGDKYGGKGDSDDDGNYMKFSRQFVIPIIEEREIKSMVILDLNLALSPDAPSDFYRHEPRARDALMSSLLDLADRGLLSGEIGSERTIGYIRQRLTEAVNDALGSDVEEVLILDFVRQDV